MQRGAQRAADPELAGVCRCPCGPRRQPRQAQQSWGREAEPGIPSQNKILQPRLKSNHTQTLLTVHEWRDPRRPGSSVKKGTDTWWQSARRGQSRGARPPVAQPRGAEGWGLRHRAPCPDLRARLRPLGRPFDPALPLLFAPSLANGWGRSWRRESRTWAPGRGSSASWYCGPAQGSFALRQGWTVLAAARLTPTPGVVS